MPPKVAKRKVEQTNTLLSYGWSTVKKPKVVCEPDSKPAAEPDECLLQLMQQDVLLSEPATGSRPPFDRVSAEQRQAVEADSNEAQSVKAGAGTGKNSHDVSAGGVPA